MSTVTHINQDHPHNKFKKCREELKHMLSNMANVDLRAQLFQNCTPAEFKQMDNPFYRKDAITFMLARFERNFAQKWEKENGFPFRLIGGTLLDFLPYLPRIYWKIWMRRLRSFMRKDAGHVPESPFKTSSGATQEALAEK